VIRVDGSTDTGEGRFAAFRNPSVVWYDYTKNPIRMHSQERGSNYHVTLSYSGENHGACYTRLRDGGNVAVVFDTPHGAPLPEKWHGFPVLDADTDDLRFLDPPGHVAGLRFKQSRNRAAAIARAGSFVVRTTQ
jgi:hypothetical protein